MRKALADARREARNRAAASLGPSNDDSPAVQVEMRAAELVGQGFGPMADAEVFEDPDFTPDPEQIAGWLAREISESRAADPERDATVWAWDISRPIAEQLTEAASDDAASGALEPAACPTCTSPAPHLHPAAQHGGECHVCVDAFHCRVTASNTPDRIRSFGLVPAQPDRAR